MYNLVVWARPAALMGFVGYVGYVGYVGDCSFNLSNPPDLSTIERPRMTPFHTKFVVKR